MSLVAKGIRDATLQTEHNAPATLPFCPSPSLLFLLRSSPDSIFEGGGKEDCRGEHGSASYMKNLHSTKKEARNGTSDRGREVRQWYRVQLSIVALLLCR